MPPDLSLIRGTTLAKRVFDALELGEANARAAWESEMLRAPKTWEGAREALFELLRRAERAS